jgi:hypothetical protein
MKGSKPPETSEVKTSSPASTMLEFRKDFIPTMDWSCTMTEFKQIFKSLGGGNGTYTGVKWDHTFTISWAGKTDPNGEPLNEYKLLYKANIPNSMGYEGPKETQSTVHLQTLFTPGSTWPAQGDGPLIRTFRFVGKTQEGDKDYQFKERLINGETSEEKKNIASTRFVRFSLVMSKLMLPDPEDPNESSSRANEKEAECQITKVHLQLGEPVQLVHADDGGRPTLINQELVKISGSHADYQFEQTLGSLGLRTKDLKSEFDKKYIPSPYNGEKKIAVINRLGIHIGNVLKSPPVMKQGKARSGLLITDPLSFWSLGAGKGPSLILWDGSEVYRPISSSQITYSFYGPGGRRSKEFNQFVELLCHEVVRSSQSCSKEEVDGVLRQAEDEIKHIPRPTPRCGP